VQPDADLPADQRGVVRARRGLRHLERRDARAHPQRIGAAHPLRRGRLSRGARLRTDLGAAVRRAAVIRARRWIVACVVAGLALRAAFALFYWTGQPLTHDEREYLALARSLARGEGYRYPTDEPAPGTGQQFGRAPGYPAFLATFIEPVPADHVPRRVQLVQSLVGAVGILLIAAIAGRAGGPRSAVAAAAVSALYPPLVWMPAYALSETLYSTVVLAVALVLGAEKKGTV